MSKTLGSIAVDIQSNAKQFTADLKEVCEAAEQLSQSLKKLKEYGITVRTSVEPERAVKPCVKEVAVDVTTR